MKDCYRNSSIFPFPSLPPLLFLLRRDGCHWLNFSASLKSSVSIWKHQRTEVLSTDLRESSSQQLPTMRKPRQPTMTKVHLPLPLLPLLPLLLPSPLSVPLFHLHVTTAVRMAQRSSTLLGLRGGGVSLPSAPDRPPWIRGTDELRRPLSIPSSLDRSYPGRRDLSLRGSLRPFSGRTASRKVFNFSWRPTEHRATERSILACSP